jgi:predicted dehydrogenase
MTTRREFIKTGALGVAGISLAIDACTTPVPPVFSGDRIRVGIIGFSERAQHSLIPSFLSQCKELNFEIVAVSDIWSKRREEAEKYLAKEGIKVKLYRNNEELYASKSVDAVIISTADFQHATHAIEAVQAGKDAYVEKPFAETMEDARMAKDAILKSGKIVQIGSQRRSASNYIAAYDYIKSGKFGPIVMVEMTWNVNQPDRWRRPDLVAQIKEADTDWKRFIINRPFEAWDPRKYIEYRLFWPYSSGIPGQWMSHQIDTVHWFSRFAHPRSVAVNGGIYVWKDGRKNADTLTAVFDYGPTDDLSSGFQVVYSSRFTNSFGGVKELYFSNGGMLNLEKNKITSDGGLDNYHAKPMGMKENLLSSFTLPEIQVKTGANTGNDPMTTAHMRNWMECIRNRQQPNADVNAGYHHSIANIMVTAALHTGEKATFDEQSQEVLAGGKIFKF